MPVSVVVLVLEVADHHPGLERVFQWLRLPMSRWRGRRVRSLPVLPFVACASFAARRHQRTGRPGLRGAWRRPYWDMPIDRSVPPTMEGDVFHDGHRDRCAQAGPYRCSC
jgi:hypothetical protein